MAVDEIDHLVTANISILDLWRNRAAVVGMLGLGNTGVSTILCRKREAESDVSYSGQSVLGCVQISCCYINCMSL